MDALLWGSSDTNRAKIWKSLWRIIAVICGCTLFLALMYGGSGIWMCQQIHGHPFTHSWQFIENWALHPHRLINSGIFVLMSSLIFALTRMYVLVKTKTNQQHISECTHVPRRKNANFLFLAAVIWQKLNWDEKRLLSSHLEPFPAVFWRNFRTREPTPATQQSKPNIVWRNEYFPFLQKVPF